MEANSKSAAEHLHNTRLENTTSVPADQRQEPISNIPIIATQVSWVGPCVAIVLQLAVAAVIVIFAFAGVWLQHNAESASSISLIPTAVRVSYLTWITVLATLISSFASGQIQTLWLLHILQRPTFKTVTLHERRQTSVLVGQGGLLNKAKAWPIAITFLITGLTTTAIVAGLSLSNDNCEFQLRNLLNNFLR